MNTWQQNNPFLAMLAAVDDPEEDNTGAANHQHQQRLSGNLKLPEFWSAAPAIWFARAKLHLEVAGVQSEQEMFAHAVYALLQDATPPASSPTSSPIPLSTTPTQL